MKALDLLCALASVMACVLLVAIAVSLTIHADGGPSPVWANVARAAWVALACAVLACAKILVGMAR